MKQIQFNASGRPADVARCVDVPDPVRIADDQVLVRVDMFPINPADLLLLRGIYPRNPPNGDALGNEATGSVEAVGAAVRGIAPGDRVISLRTDNWRELLLLRESELIRLDPDIEPETAAVLKVNPATASLLLDTHIALSPGDWVIQNAANSAVGRALIVLAAARGIRTTECRAPAESGGRAARAWRRSCAFRCRRSRRTGDCAYRRRADPVGY